MHFLAVGGIAAVELVVVALAVVMQDNLGFSFSLPIQLGGWNISSVSVVEEEGIETLSSVCAVLGFTLPLTLRFCLSFFLELVFAVAVFAVLVFVLVDVDSGVCRKGHCALVHPRRVLKYRQRGLVLFMLVLLVSL
jgi:hypothetical protein